MRDNPWTDIRRRAGESSAAWTAPRYYYEARTRFFSKHFGTGGLLLANAAWLLGRTVSLSRQVLLGTDAVVRDHEAKDIWRNVLHPFRPSAYYRPKRTRDVARFIGASPRDDIRQSGRRASASTRLAT